MTVPSVHCEALKVAYRQTKDGLVVSFVIHPNDMPDALAVAPLGTRYMLVVSQIGDDEMPVSPGAGAKPEVATMPEPQATPAASVLGGDGGRTAGSIPATGEPYAAKERYAAMSLAEQAKTRAALLPRDERFRAWVAHERGWAPLRGFGPVSEDEAIEHIRNTCCNGGSRALITDDPECYDKFLALETSFRVAVGEMAEPR